MPLPFGITLDAKPAESKAIDFFATWYQKTALPDQKLMLRTFLQPSNELKESWSISRGMNPQLAWALRSHLLSRWVWDSELQSYEQFKSKSKQALGQIIQDSASPRQDTLDLLAYHMPSGEAALIDPRRAKRTVQIKHYTSFPIVDRGQTHS